MAVDTRDKRFSLVGLALASLNVLPNPDNDLDTEEDRLHLAYLYRVALTAPTPSVGGKLPPGARQGHRTLS